MLIEIHYSIRSSDSICINFLDKKSILKSYARKKILQIMKKTTVAFVSVASCIYHCSFLSGSSPGNVRC